jgi:aspartate-semialdehyde dehydrogenase
MRKPAYAVGVVGATGLVGREILSALDGRGFPLAELRVYSSIRSAGEEVRCGPCTTRVDLLERARFEHLDIVFLAAGERVSAQLAGRVADAGAVVIDSGQLFVDDADVPVIVPEVNAAALGAFDSRHIVISPDTPAIALAVVLNPLRDAAGLRRVVATTFEPVSGAGQRGIEELQRQTIDLMNGQSTENEVFQHRIAFNVLPQVGEFLAGGSSTEEHQGTAALRRILDAPDLAVSLTRVRVPLFYGTGIALNVETDAPWSAEQAREVLRSAPGVFLQDDADAMQYPTPGEAVGQEATCVGRIRSATAETVVDIWICLDNLRKGSAVNAVQIAEVLVRDHL